MKTRSEIREEILSNLSSPTWLQVKNSLLGSELVALGTEIVYRATLASDSIFKAQDYKNSSYPDLINLARRHNFSVSDKEPSYVKAQATEFLKPYESVLQYGGVTFTSDSWYNSGDIATYYQGQSKCIHVNTAVSKLFSGTQSKDYASWSDFTIDPDLFVTINGVTYVKLGINALPSSVKLFFHDDSGRTRQIPQVMPGATYENFTLVTLEDGNIAIELPDTASTSGFQLYWIDLSFDEFSSEEGTVLESHVGSTNNLEYARALYTQYIYQFFVLNSLEDMKNYTDSAQGVLDSMVVQGNGNQVVVYIKPTERVSAEDYSAIRYYLTLHGPLFTDYSVKTGTEVVFQFVIDSSYSPQSISKGQIEELVRSMYPYSEMDFNSEVVASDVVSRAFVDLGVRLSVALQASESFNDTGSYRTSFLPKSSTLKFVDSSNRIRGFDRYGVIYSEVPTTNYYTSYSGNDTLGAFGKVIVAKNTDTNLPALYDAETFYGLSSIFESEIAKLGSNYTNILSKDFQWFNSSTNPMFKATINGSDKLFILNDTDFWHNPTAIQSGISVFKEVPWISSMINLNPSKFNYSDGLNKQLAVVQDNNLYITSQVGGVITLTVIDLNLNSSILYRLGNPPGTLVNLIDSNGRIYLVMNQGNIMYELILGSYYLAPIEFTLPTECTTYGLYYTKNSGAFVTDLRATEGSKVFLSTGLTLGSTTVDFHFQEVTPPTDPSDALLAADSGFYHIAYIWGSPSRSRSFVYYDGITSTGYAAYSSTYGSYVPVIDVTSIGVVSYDTGVITSDGSLNGRTLYYKGVSSNSSGLPVYYTLSEVPVLWQ